MTIDYLFAPPEQIMEAREAHFARMMDWAFARHPYLQEQGRALGLVRSDFASLADLPKLPVTTKEAYMHAPERFVLQTEGLPEEMRTVWDTMYTTGSTAGRPTPFVSTTFDFYRILELQRNMLRLRGAGPDDRIVNLFPLTRAPHGAWIRVLHAAASLNMPVICAMPGRPSEFYTLGNATDAVVRIVERSRGTILWGVPSYVARVVGRAHELGADFTAVRLVFVTGEGLGEPARSQLVAALASVGASASISVSYGATEIQGGMVECAPGSGYHNPAPDQIQVDVVDRATGQPLPDGARGLVVISHLQRTGTVLLRYALGDTSVRTSGQCPACGSWTERLTAMPRRADALTKIKGMLVNPAVVVEVLEAALGGRAFQAIIDTRGAGALAADILIVRVAVAPDEGVPAARIAERVRAAVGVSPEIQRVTPDVLADPGEAWKMKKFVDRRGS